MKKSRIQATVDPEVLERYDRIVENRSEDLEEYMRRKADMEQQENEQLVKRREEIRDKLEDVRDKQRTLEKKEESLETELKAIESSLEKAVEDKSLLEEASQAIAPVYQEEYNKLPGGVKRSNPDKAWKKVWMSEKFGMWEEKIDASRDELKDAVKSEVEEQYPELI